MTGDEVTRDEMTGNQWSPTAEHARQHHTEPETAWLKQSKTSCQKKKKKSKSGPSLNTVDQARYIDCTQCLTHLDKCHI
nr:hypothetical protein BgiMline_010444 [Biomphalaria glabrata]